MVDDFTSNILNKFHNDEVGNLCRTDPIVVFNTTGKVDIPVTHKTELTYMMGPIRMVARLLLN